MKFVVLAIMAIHGLIHLMGFIESFEMGEFDQIKEEIPRPYGVGWLIASLLFLGSSALYFTDNDYWWLPGMLSIIVSQALIFSFWESARYGTLANLFILVVVVLSYSSFNFKQSFVRQAEIFAIQDEDYKPDTLSLQNRQELPEVLKKWLIRSGVEGKQSIQTVRMKQSGNLQLNPEDGDFFKFEAQQIVQPQTQSFVWQADVDMMPVISVQAKDALLDGTGSMVVK